MKRLFFIATLIYSASLFANYSTELPGFKEIKDKVTGDRLLCNTQAEYRIARYAQCAYSDEVVVGLQSVNPVIVICSRMGVTCFRLNGEEQNGL